MTRSIAYSISIAALFAVPATAQETGQEAFDAWLKSDANLGISASYETIHEAGDTLTVSGLKYSYSKVFEFDAEKTSDGSDGDKNSVSVSISFLVPQLVAEKLEKGDAGFSVAGLTLADGTSFNAEIRGDDDDEGLALEGTIDGYSVTNAAWPVFPVVQDDPKQPVGRWLPVLNTINDFSMDEQRIKKLDLTVKEADQPGDDTSFGYVVNDLVVKDVRDGVIGEYSTGLFEQNLAGVESEGETIDMSISMASTRMEDYNFGAAADFLQGGGPPDGEFETYLGSMTMLGYRIESDFFNMNIDRIAYEDIALRPPQTNLIELIDNAIVTEDFDEEDLAHLPLEFFRSFAIGRTSIDGLSVDFRDPSDPDTSGSMKMAQFLIDDLSPDGLGEFSLSSIDVDIEPAGEVRLGRFAIEDVEFPPYAPMKPFIEKQMMSNSEPDPLEVARLFTPWSIAISAEDFFADIPGEGTASLGGFLMAMQTTVPPIPTDVVVAVDDLEIPVEALDDREAEQILKAAGISTLRLSEALEVRWDEASEDLIVDNIVVEVGDIGAVRAKARLGGLPKTILQNPMQAQAAIATLNLKSLELELVNEGGVEKALALASAQAGLSEDQMSQVLLGQLDGMLAIVGNEAFTQQVSQAAKAFFENPQNLSVEAKPSNPVPVVQILGNVQLAPQTLPDLLGVQVEANR